jgi:hypothetical protein
MSKRKQPPTNATHRKPPGQLLELVRLELKRRRLMRELTGVCDEMYQVKHEIRVLGIEIPWQKTSSTNLTPATDTGDAELTT